MKPEAERLLREGLARLGLPAGPGIMGKFMLYLSELKRWNRAYNLTAITEDREIIIKHFLDSALYLRALEGRGADIADIGSGAGFPGLVLKLLRPGLNICLVEPSWKKAAFLRHMASLLGVGVTVFEGRLEDMRPAALFDAAVTRALWKAPDFIRKASKIVKKGGFFIMSKGPAMAPELEGIEHEALRLKLPFTDAERSIIIIVNGYEKDKG